jgi:hypothetical protein
VFRDSERQAYCEAWNRCRPCLLQMGNRSIITVLVCKMYVRRVFFGIDSDSLKIMLDKPHALIRFEGFAALLSVLATPPHHFGARSDTEFHTAAIVQEAHVCTTEDVDTAAALHGSFTQTVRLGGRPWAARCGAWRRRRSVGLSSSGCRPTSTWWSSDLLDAFRRQCPDLAPRMLAHRGKTPLSGFIITTFHESTLWEFWQARWSAHSRISSVWRATSADALDFVHRNRYLHCDVSPYNIRVDLDSSGRVARARLNDFGLAREMVGFSHVSPRLSFHGHRDFCPLSMMSCTRAAAVPAGRMPPARPPEPVIYSAACDFESLIWSLWTVMRTPMEAVPVERRISLVQHPDGFCKGRFAVHLEIFRQVLLRRTAEPLDREAVLSAFQRSCLPIPENIFSQQFKI